MIRVTEAEGGCSDKCRQRLNSKISAFRSKIHKKILFYVFLPCTGGCPSGYINQQTIKGAANIEGHIKQFRSLLRGLKRVLNEIYDDDVRIAFRLPKASRYWKWPELWSFLTQYKMNKYEFHGCKSGMTGRNGEPMKKQWVVASNIPIISVEYFKCDGKHEHDESRGTHLKEAEGYTHVYTDAVHTTFSACSRCFRVIVLHPLRNEQPHGICASCEGLRPGTEAMDGEFGYKFGAHQCKV